MNNKKDLIGGWRIHKPELVTKLCVVMNDYKFSYREELWLESETKAADQLYQFNPKDRFYEETLRQGNLVYQFRYYTPESNRSKNGH